ncbi:MAG: HEAT repeat domain-containing protein, partial [Deltaproteobacteria bacterium]|nr:HEAT repeat domain-containing protein [Deltaproteobacteria bacterium]
MADKHLPHVERLEAVAASEGLIAIAGRRDVAGARTSVHLAKLPKCEPLGSVEIDDAVHSLAFSGRLLCAGTAGGDLHLWKVSDTEALVAFGIDVGRHGGPVRAVLAHDGEWVATVGDDGVLKVSTIGDRGFSTTMARQLSPRGLRALAHAPDDGLIAAGGDDGVARSLATTDIENGDVRDMPMGDAIFSLEFLGDGRLAAGCGKGGLRFAYLEGAPEPEDRAKDAAHDGPVRTLIYSAQLLDGAKRRLPRRLISTSEDGTIKAWQVDSRRKPPTTTVSSSALSCAVLVPGSSRAKPERRGGTLAVVDTGRTLSLLPVDEEGKPGDDITRVRSLFEQTAAELKAKKDEVRVQACSTLAPLPEDEARRQLDRALRKDKSPVVRRAAAAAIGQGNRRLSRPALREALSDGEKKVRESALRALEKIESDAPVAAARAALDSSKADMRVTAIGKLPALREQSPLVPALIAKALSDGEADVRTAALDALYKLDVGKPLNAA